MPEKTKEEISDEVNKLLGTLIEFTKLSKDELTSLSAALVKFKETSTFALPILDKPIGDILEKRIGGKSVRETSLRELLGLPNRGSKGGLLGFGLLGNLLRSPEEKKAELETT